ncbi:MAG: hypothetical protein Q8N08_09510 [Methanobacteriaceae archaeon]|nr:hypothetical protein [Methanobacteriaceae archaeon]
MEVFKFPYGLVGHILPEDVILLVQNFAREDLHFHIQGEVLVGLDVVEFVYSWLKTSRRN